MSERYVLGAYWKARREAAFECAERLEAFLRGLRICDELMGQWYVKTTSPKMSLKDPITSLEHGNLTKILVNGSNRENVAGTVSEDLGFQVESWNGHRGDKEASLSLRCGLYWKPATPGVSIGNCVVLDLPKSIGTLADLERITQLLETTALAWQPDWAGVMSESSMIARNFDADKPFVDWMVYVPRRIHGVSEPSFASELREDGSIVVVRADPPTVGDQDSLSFITRVDSLVSRAT